jgi:hypothetical protein
LVDAAWLARRSLGRDYQAGRIGTTLLGHPVAPPATKPVRAASRPSTNVSGAPTRAEPNPADSSAQPSVGNASSLPHRPPSQPSPSGWGLRYPQEGLEPLRSLAARGSPGSRRPVAGGRPDHEVDDVDGAAGPATAALRNGGHAGGKDHEAGRGPARTRRREADWSVADTTAAAPS